MNKRLIELNWEMLNHENSHKSNIEKPNKNELIRSYGLGTFYTLRTQKRNLTTAVLHVKKLYPILRSHNP